MHNPVISAIITASPAVTTGVTADVNMADADVSSEVRWRDAHPTPWAVGEVVIGVLIVVVAVFAGRYL